MGPLALPFLPPPHSPWLRGLCCLLSRAGLHFSARGQRSGTPERRVFGCFQGFLYFILPGTQQHFLPLSPCLMRGPCSPTGSKSHDRGSTPTRSPVPSSSRGSTNSCCPNWMAASPPSLCSDEWGHCSSDTGQLASGHTPHRPWG